MLERDVERVIVPAPSSDGAGVVLRRSIGTRELDHLDPFFLFDHLGSEDPDDYIAGFPLHPHRGIETITYVLEGRVEHRDSIGNRGVVGPGDVQWMTAGSGILHEEMPRVGPHRLNGFQIWVNLPAALKMTKPRYQDVPSAKIPEVVRSNGTRIRVIAGMVDDTAGAVREIFAEPTYLDVALPAGIGFEHLVPRGQTALLYLFEGELAVGKPTGRIICATRLVVLSDGDILRVCAGGSPARFLILAAQPLNEPAVRYGPFVMNTREEVALALRELEEGTFIKTQTDQR